MYIQRLSTALFLLSVLFAGCAKKTKPTKPASGTCVSDKDCVANFVCQEKLCSLRQNLVVLELHYVVEHEAGIRKKILFIKESLERKMIEIETAKKGIDIQGLSDEDRRAYKERFSVKMKAGSALELHFQNEKDAALLTGKMIEDLGEGLLWTGSGQLEQSLVIKAEQLSRWRDAGTEQNVHIMRKRLEALGMKSTSEVLFWGPGEIHVKFTDLAKERHEELRAILTKEGQLTFRIVDDESSFLQDLAKSLPDYLTNNKGAGRAHTIESFVDPNTGKHSFRAQRKEELVSFMKTAKIPADHIIAFERYRDITANQPAATYWRAYYLFERVELSGLQVSKAFIALTDEGDYLPKDTPYISIEMTEDGKETFANVTTKYVEKRLAILFDDQVLTAPMIRERISGGRLRLDLGSSDSRNNQLRLAQEIVRGVKHGSYAFPVRLERELVKGGQKDGAKP